MAIDLGKEALPSAFPNLLVVLGAGAVLSSIQGIGLDPTKRYILGGFGLTVLLVGVLLYVLKREPVNLPEPPLPKSPVTAGAPHVAAQAGIISSAPPLQSAPAHVRLNDVLRAIDAVRDELAQQRVIRSGLVFKLEFEVAEEPESVERAMVSLTVEFVLENFSDLHVTVPLVAAFETCALSAESKHSGVLRVNRFFAGQTDGRTQSIEFVPDAQRSISRAHPYTVDLPPNSNARVEWSATYMVNLPYTEFWATSIPTFGLRVEVKEAARDPLVASADCYATSSKQFQRYSPQNSAGRYVLRRHIFELLGPVLPFQGIFLRLAANRIEGAD